MESHYYSYFLLHSSSFSFFPFPHSFVLFPTFFFFFIFREKRLGGITHTSRAYFGGAPSFRSIKKGKPHTFKAVGSMQGDATTRKDRVMIGSNDNDLGDNEDDLDQQDTNAPDYR